MTKPDHQVSYKHHSSHHQDTEHEGTTNTLPSETTTRKASNNKKRATPSSASTHIKHDAPVPTKGDGQRPVRKPNPPALRSIDTMEMDAYISPEEIESAIERLKLLVSDKRAKRVTSQSQFWKATFSVPLGTELEQRSVSATFYFDCTARGADIPMRLQFNVGLMKVGHVDKLMDAFKEVFPYDYKRVAAALRVHGVDEAYDHEGNLEDFILEHRRATVVARYYIKTGAGGEIQTAYTGSVDSPSHGVLYDIESADVYRNALGQPVPLNKDTAADTFECRKGMIRIESRRVFKDHPLTLEELLKLPSAFHEYLFFDLTRLSARDRRDSVFMGFVDSVRLRGLNAAVKRLQVSYGGGRPAIREVKQFEDRLAACSCTWWSALDHSQQLGKLLRAAPIWKFLKHTAKA